MGKGVPHSGSGRKKSLHRIGLTLGWQRSHGIRSDQTRGGANAWGKKPNIDKRYRGKQHCGEEIGVDSESWLGGWLLTEFCQEGKYKKSCPKCLKSTPHTNGSTFFESRSKEKRIWTKSLTVLEVDDWSYFDTKFWINYIRNYINSNNHTDRVERSDNDICRWYN